jgi:hypothetical protein
MILAAIDRLVHHATILEMNAELSPTRCAEKSMCQPAGNQ